MAVTVVSCYFIPFLFFFLAHFAFPKSIAPFVVGVGALSLSSLILYFQILAQKPREVVRLVTKEKEETPITSAPKIAVQASSPIVDYAKRSFLKPVTATLPDVRAIIEEKDQALTSQKELFKEELEKHSLAIAELKKALNMAEDALYAKNLECARQTKELQDVKFELYTLLRIESYGNPKEKLAAASF